MKVIPFKDTSVAKLIVPIDDSVIKELVGIAFNCTKDTETHQLRTFLYKSKYTIADSQKKQLEQKESMLENAIDHMNDSKIRMKKQNSEYQWILIDEGAIGPTSTRFYLAPNPNNMHEIVAKLTKSFASQNIAVKFKYQLSTGMEACDRIIIYSDEKNKDKIQSAIKTIYTNNPVLFQGCEKSLAWIYGTDTPGVYKAPETPGVAYSNAFAEAILHAKESFNFLYELTDKKPTLNLTRAEKDKAYEYMEMLVSSSILRQGLMLDKNGRKIVCRDKNIYTYLNRKDGTLKVSAINQDGYYEVLYEPTRDGKNAFLNNFYSVSGVEKQSGLQKRYLTLRERQEEINRILFGSNKNSLKR